MWHHTFPKTKANKKRHWTRLGALNLDPIFIWKRPTDLPYLAGLSARKTGFFYSSFYFFFLVATGKIWVMQLFVFISMTSLRWITTISSKQIWNDIDLSPQETGQNHAKKK